MPEPPSLLIVYTTLPDPATADAMAQALIEARLAACVQIYPGMIAHYRWQGRVERAGEVGVLIKSLPGRRDALLAAIRTHHPYEVPAIVVLPPAAANADYAAWVEAETGPAAAMGGET